MTISNDVITVQASDISAFSAGMQAALVSYVGTNSTPQAYLSDLINNALQTALRVAGANNAALFDQLTRAYVKANSATQSAALSEINQLRGTLGV